MFARDALYGRRGGQMVGDLSVELVELSQRAPPLAAHVGTLVKGGSGFVDAATRAFELYPKFVMNSHLQSSSVVLVASSTERVHS
jgi:hypothetical protein